jgi:hypothetical protein
MLKHEAKLIDPAADEIEAALAEATAAANKRCRARLLADDPAKWRKFARDAAKQREGYALFRGGKGGIPATQLLAAWWTDAAGRKHVVLRGRRVEHAEAKRLLQKDDLDKRPPLWHAYPEYVCRRTVRGESQLVCACGCGAVGTPESLGWMGETCGPCHDRKEELGAAALRTNLPGVLYGDRSPLRAVACSPDGTRVAAVEGENVVAYWDIPRRTRTVMKFNGAQVTDVAIASDGRHLIAVGMGTLGAGGLFAAFDLSTDPPARVDPADAERPDGWRAFALPDPELVLVHQTIPPTMTGRAEVVRAATVDVVGTAGLWLGRLVGMAVSPDGRRLAAADGSGGGLEIHVYDLGGSAPRCTLPGAQHRRVVFSHDGERVITSSIDGVRAYDATTGRPCGPAVRGHGRPSDWISELGVDPGGEWVFVGGSAGTVAAIDARTLDRRAAFEWHLGVVHGLATSADGSRLFSSSWDGCVKVWPIRDLMKGL